MAGVGQVATEFASQVRMQIYVRWIEDGAPPAAGEVAQALRRGVAEVEDAFVALAEARAIVLAPGARSVWMAHPLSAIPTAYRVAFGDRSCWANCAWDALGVAAMLGQDTECIARCADCDERIDLSVRGGKVGDEAVVHFAVPPRDFWKDIGHT
jgi:hypothetical protein